MKSVTPKVYLIGETEIHDDGIADYLDDIGAEDWETCAPSDGEELIEIGGRLCYRSWFPGMNANVTKVREGNDTYLKNILKVGHGSVLEHSTVSFIFHNVSRVFTHELVRHRVGTAYSQESLRFVRLTELGIWFPPETLNEIADNCGFEAMNTFIADMSAHVREIELLQEKWAKLFKLDDGKDFGYKKKATSMMRRAAPIGLATAIMFTTNHRNLRHVLTMRTNRHAEEEMRLVFEQVGNICIEKFPNLYADFTFEKVGGYTEFVPQNNKI